MLAGKCTAPGRIELVDVPEPELDVSAVTGSGQIVFQPEITCLCGSDRPFFLGSDEFPIELGHSLHEMIGSVVSSNGTRFQCGDRDAQNLV